ncbi:unnamed protein product [Acanthoscelides obtectus]|uniref:Uncharacterized protein n=1 Tax=Acanthoscelides obtectus TaxID=200917 RepID=A0A9P0JTY3_ACAOB|nr:unnamed protein product [Acanthoscelides obtectus]CAK1642884.1 hypothetical protein AOBTE_LOCUS13267 [Acanthoscelides obtectus]
MVESKRVSSPITRRDTESIKVKIRRANMLVDRVKEALDGIRFKDKGSTSSCSCTEPEPRTKPNASSDSDKENDCCFIIQQSKAQLDAQLKALELGIAPKPIPTKITVDLDPSRPKTRRCSEDEHDAQERYRMTPTTTRTPPPSMTDPGSTSSDEGDDRLRLVKAKLTAISEQATEVTESESEKIKTTCATTCEAACNTLAVETITSATNTEPPRTMHSIELQCSPCGMSKGTQSYTPALEKSLQTEEKKNAVLTCHTAENAAIPPKCCNQAKLIIQHLPPVEVRSHNRHTQSLLHYSIENNETKLLFKSDTCNVGFQMAKSADLTDQKCHETENLKNKNDQRFVFPENENDEKLLKIMEKGSRVCSSSENMIEMKTPRLARRILELENPGESTNTIDRELAEAIETEGDHGPPAIIADLNLQLGVAETKRSISEVIESSEECLFTNTLPEKSSVTEDTSKFPSQLAGVHCPERERVLKSYHVYDNPNDHDPGFLNERSLELVSKVDDKVYRTYINPKGFQKPPHYETSNPLVSSDSVKRFGLSKVSSLRLKSALSTDNTKDTALRDGLPKIWSLGFYVNKSTQVSPSVNQNTSKLQSRENEENTADGEEKAIQVINFTQSDSRFQLTNTEDDYPTPQLPAERDGDPFYKPIDCEGLCSQMAADLRTAITYIQQPKEEVQLRSEVGKKPIEDTPEEIENAKCSSCLTISKVSVPTRHSTIGETAELKREATICGREYQELCSRSPQPTPRVNKKSVDAIEQTRDGKNGGEETKTSTRKEDGSQATLVEYRTLNGSQLETISLTVSYSTGESVEMNPPSPDMQSTTNKSGTAIMREKRDIKSRTQFNKSVNNITTEGKVVLRALKDKLDVKRTPESRLNVDAIDEEDNGPVEFNEDVSGFISGLTETSEGELKRVLPMIRSRKSLSRPPKRYDVNYVFGDFHHSKFAEVLAKKASKQKADPLKATGNDRLKDECNEGRGRSSKPKTLPTRQPAPPFTCEKPEPQIVRRVAKHPGHHKHKNRRNFKLETTSNSETITTERSKSEGELTSCSCVVSNGELHSCRYDQFHRMNPPIFNDTDELVTTIRKKRSYFNNCVTYYLKRTPIPGPPYSSNRNVHQELNDASISSNTTT